VLAHSIPFLPQQDSEAFAQVPAAAGVFLLRPHESGAEPYITKSADMRRRVSRLLGPEPGISKRLNLRARCGAIEFTQTGSEFESTLLLYRTLKQIFPETYARRMRIAPAPLVRVDWSDPYPRAYVTTKLSRFSMEAEASSHFFGPFRARAAAEQFLNDALDLFKSRRCTFDIHPDPAFPGCVYSEMKMCLAPCFAGCSDEEYRAEMQRAEAFLETRGSSLLAELGGERERASAALEFEAAAALHAKVEKVKAVARQCDELIRRLEQLDCVILQRAAEKNAMALFRVSAGEIMGPALLTLPKAEESADAASEDCAGQQIESEEESPAVEVVRGDSPPPADAKRLRHELQASIARALEQLQPSPRLPAQARSEQLGIFKRWYYRSHRGGELVLCYQATPPHRRIARVAMKMMERD